MRLARHLIQTRFVNDTARNDHKTSRPYSGALDRWTADAGLRCDHSSEFRRAKIILYSDHHALFVHTVIAEQGLFLALLGAEFLGSLCGSRLGRVSSNRSIFV